ARPAAVGALTVLATLVGLSAAARLALRLGDPDGAAAGTAAVLCRRLCTGNPMVFTMLAAAAGPVWLAALVATVLPVRPAAVGALTVLATLVGLSAAARLALRLGDPDGAAAGTAAVLCRRLCTGNPMVFTMLAAASSFLSVAAAAFSASVSGM
ncbi:hypothetical protein, partial [Mycolicibacterium fallax]|uniref:hypothetical protein n=1 Tax=Mycolicibacterium fallax TaxID=1793 RepID=UPI003908A7DC